MKPTLLIMAAGLGSRYGGLKQIDPVGPHGEILLEFALRDALSFGIEEVVVIVSETIRADFESMIVPKYPELKITLVTQTLSSLPEGISQNPERTKPWGTAHAVWCARDVIKGPFIVMNADDFYGRDALKQAYDFLVSTNSANGENLGNPVNTSHCIVTYPITSTLSEYGTVSRGICAVENDKLIRIVEHTKVSRKDGRLIHTAEDGHEVLIPKDAPANMNLFGFQQSFFDILESECQRFFEAFSGDEKREFFLPSVVMQVIKENAGTITAISTTSQWFGMTYPEDRQEAKSKIQTLIDGGAYL
ncbi:nucleotidyltransferase [Candidatus Gracilibacteria bacterium]|nr:nucleotidyltransferase [Candidatus Gracilibacteria bacterium]